jgi:DNA-binding NarL/FixJ family response regulator
MDDIRVLVLADDPLARAGLATMLAGRAGTDVVGQVDGTDPVEAIGVYRPDVVAWDLGWDPVDALDRLSALDGVAVPVLGLVSDESQVQRAWAAGARGVLLRDVDAETMDAAVAAVASGVAVFDPQLSPPSLPLVSPPDGQLAEQLTPRELDVLKLLAEGLPNKQIADRLDISDHTVKFHVNGLLRKLGAHSRTEAVTVATRSGLIHL